MIAVRSLRENAVAVPFKHRAHFKVRQRHHVENQEDFDFDRVIVVCLSEDNNKKARSLIV